MRLFRLIKIVSVGVRFGLDELILQFEPSGRLLKFSRRIFYWRNLTDPPAVRLRRALEALGPIFVKFGQMLSTRRDLLTPAFADELAKLQDRVPPFDPDLAVAQIERSLGKPLDQLYRNFDREPIASASVAQVHFAALPDGTPVAVKVLRPGVHAVIDKDIALLEVAAAMLETLWPASRRLKPREVVAEFRKHLIDELDLMREASNCSQLRRNFSKSDVLVVPELHWDHCTNSVMTMQRMYGLPVSQVEALRAQGVDISQLARVGVEIFFTQVFRDGFFHADMHPGNIFVSNTGQYIALDFGIMGTLNDVDKNYLAQNFLAFFQRDYKRVAQAHIDAGWAPRDTRVDEFEAAIRSVCEPIFDKPLKEISFGRVLLRLFQTSRRFNVEIQPQLVLLQKTLLNIEGLGRQLDPDLDLWKTAKPYLERWMREQVGLEGLLHNIAQEAPAWSRSLPEIPRLIHHALLRQERTPWEDAIKRLHEEQRRQRWLLGLLSLGILAIALIELLKLRG